MPPDVAYAEAVKVLTILPASEKNDFARWVERPETFASAPMQLVVDFDLELDNPLIGAQALPDTLKASLAQLLENLGSDQWGELDGDYLLLRLEIPRGGQTGKLLVLHHSVVLQALETLYPHTSLTPAEQRIVMQVVAGLSPKAAALIDHVSSETKRTQLKSAMSKTAVSSQKDLSSALIAHLALELSSNRQQQSTKPDDPDAWLTRYIRRYFPTDTRYHVSRGNSGHHYRCLDCGDPQGDVLIYLHQLGAFHCSLQMIEHAKAYGIRLLVPLRNGAVAPRDPELSVADHLSHAMQGIQNAIQIAGVNRATLMAGTSGCAYALQFLDRHPDKLHQLILTAASFRGDSSLHSTDKYIRSGYRLASSNRLLFKSMLAYLRRSFRDRENLKRFYTQVHRGSPADQQVLEDIFNDEHAATALQYRIIHSAPSLLQDLHHLAKPDASPLANSRVPIHFIHGEQDVHVDIGDIEMLAESLDQATIHRISGGGTWLLDNNTTVIFDLIGKLLRDPALKVRSATPSIVGKRKRS
jgi:pimeloyl-ACP methyl ester carboxylesterase/DNA-binding CsgD family transcriptional regulator